MNKWTLLAVLLIVLGVADWLSGGLGPRLVFGTATIDLKTSPEGAAVTLNGERAGVTPVTLSDVRPGAVVLHLRTSIPPGGVAQTDAGPR